MSDQPGHDYDCCCGTCVPLIGGRVTFALHRADRCKREVDDLKAQLEAATKELDWYKSGDVHTCHAECDKPMCKMRRERDAALAKLGGRDEATYQHVSDPDGERKS